MGLRIDSETILSFAYFEIEMPLVFFLLRFLDDLNETLKFLSFFFFIFVVLYFILLFSGGIFFICSFP